MTDEVKNFIKTHFPDYDEKSVFGCADGVTWLFRTRDSQDTKVVYRDRATNELKILVNPR